MWPYGGVIPSPGGGMQRWHSLTACSGSSTQVQEPTSPREFTKQFSTLLWCRFLSQYRYAVYCSLDIQALLRWVWLTSLVWCKDALGSLALVTHLLVVCRIMLYDGTISQLGNSRRRGRGPDPLHTILLRGLDLSALAWVTGGWFIAKSTWLLQNAMQCSGILGLSVPAVVVTQNVWVGDWVPTSAIESELLHYDSASYFNKSTL